MLVSPAVATTPNNDAGREPHEYRLRETAATLSLHLSAMLRRAVSAEREAVTGAVIGECAIAIPLLLRSEAARGGGGEAKRARGFANHFATPSFDRVADLGHATSVPNELIWSFSLMTTTFGGIKPDQNLVPEQFAEALQLVREQDVHMRKDVGASRRICASACSCDFSEVLNIIPKVLNAPLAMLFSVRSELAHSLRAFRPGFGGRSRQWTAVLKPRGGISAHDYAEGPSEDFLIFGRGNVLQRRRQDSTVGTAIQRDLGQVFRERHRSLSPRNAGSVFHAPGEIRALYPLVHVHRRLH